MSKAIVIDFEFFEVEPAPGEFAHFLMRDNRPWMQIVNPENDPPMETMVNTEEREFRLLRLVDPKGGTHLFYVNWPDVEAATRVLKAPYEARMSEAASKHKEAIDAWQTAFNRTVVERGELEASYKIMLEVIEFSSIWQRIKFLFTGKLL